jgi:hypothetical protein
MIDELGRIWKEAVIASLKCYTGICLEGLSKTVKTVIQDLPVPQLRFQTSIF